MSTTRILDQGYRRYEGPRRGTGSAVRSLIAYTLRRVLGLGRPARTKILPVLTIAFSYLPATAFVGVVALLGRRVTVALPNYGDYYGFVISAIILFVTFVAPEAVCPDRRYRTLSLYLASPLSRLTWLAAKAASVAAVLAVVTVGPPLLLLIGLVLQNAGPDGPGDVVVVLLRILASGALLAVLYTSVSMAVASLTDRRAVAAAGTLLLLVGSGIVTGTLHFGLDAPAWVLSFNLGRAPRDLVTRIYGEPGLPPHVDTLPLVAGVLGWTVLGAVVTLWRTLRLQVTR